MKLVEVVAVEDRSRAEGGHAVILLRGVERTSPSVTFNLTPMVAEDDEETEPPSAGLTGLCALEVTMTADGMALAIGPEIAESALFVPGAAVEITLPDVGVRGEFPWPAVTPLARPKRRNIMLKRNSADPLLRQLPAGSAGEAVRPEAAGSDIQMQSQPVVSSSDDMPEATEPMRPQSSGRRPIVLSSTLPRRAIPDRANDPAHPADTALPSQVEPKAPSVTALSPIATVGSPEPVTAASLPEDLPVPAPSRAKVETARQEPQPPRSAVGIRDVAGDVTAAPEASPLASRSSPASPQPSRRQGGRMSTGSAVALAVAFLVAGQMIALRALNLSVVPRQPATSATAAATNEPASAAAVPMTMAMPAQDPSPVRTPAPEKAEMARPLPAEAQSLPLRNVYEVIAAGPLSPRGVAATGVTPAKSLQLAHGLLHGPEAERDPEEAAYWLKHYLAGATGSGSVRIALTQLGSAYAQPVRGERDFVSARIVWELSAALGDTVAMCFLGAMHEHGLGGPRGQTSAVTWYDRAAALGRTCATSGDGVGSERR